MKYMGSKNRIAADIMPIILKNRKPNQFYVEPFVGGANMIDKVSGNRIGADLNPYLILALELIKNSPDSIPDLITEEDYMQAKSAMLKNGLTGFIGFAMSFGGKWFGGYRRDVAGSKGDKANMLIQTRRSKQSALNQSIYLQGVELLTCSYDSLLIPNNIIIYCDPPYENTTKYSNGFDHFAFWQWCRDMTIKGHSVFISEYNAPDDFACIWEKKLNTTLSKQSGKVDTEKLFVYCY